MPTLLDYRRRFFFFYFNELRKFRNQLTDFPIVQGCICLDFLAICPADCSNCFMGNAFGRELLNGQATFWALCMVYIVLSCQKD